ncbi:MAG: hypothetical protein QXM01_06045 [Candidatus Bathyarchaeia archaeon]
MREVFALLMVFLILTSAAYILPAVAADSEEEMPREWYGRRKVVDRIGKYVRIAIIHYLTDVGDPDKDGAEDGYALLGVYWNLSRYSTGVPYIINPSGGVKQGLSEASIVSEIKAALESWDWAVDLDNYRPPDKVRHRIELYNDEPLINYKAKASIGTPDLRNVISWGRAQPGVVAYAVIWYIPNSGEIVDADIVLNSYYRWGIADGDEATSDLVGKFDIRNIVAHEAGHWTGLDDIYDPNYSAMTMYGYADFGEEIKRSLEPGDIAGAQAIYRV